MYETQQNPSPTNELRVLVVSVWSFLSRHLFARSWICVSVMGWHSHGWLWVERCMASCNWNKCNLFCMHCFAKLRSYSSWASHLLYSVEGFFSKPQYAFPQTYTPRFSCWHAGLWFSLLIYLSETPWFIVPSFSLNWGDPCTSRRTSWPKSSGSTFSCGQPSIDKKAALT